MFVKNKKGQFYLLAAVIISIIIIGINSTTNKVVVQEGKFRDVEDFSEEVWREINEVLNYEIYTDGDGSKVEEFAELMAKRMRDKDPDTEFIFIFGNDEEMAITNYGEKDIEFVTEDLDEAVYCRYRSDGKRIDNNKEGVSKKECSSNTNLCWVCERSCGLTLNKETCSKFEIIEGIKTIEPCSHVLGTKSCSKIDGEAKKRKISGEKLKNKNSVSIALTTESGDKINFEVPVIEHKQVHMIVKKDSDGETFISNY